MKVEHTNNPMEVKVTTLVRKVAEFRRPGSLTFPNHLGWIAVESSLVARLVGTASALVQAVS